MFTSKKSPVLRTNNELVICGCIIKYYETESGKILKSSIQITDRNKKGLVLSNRQRRELVDFINEVTTGTNITENDRKIYFASMGILMSGMLTFAWNLYSLPQYMN